MKRSLPIVLAFVGMSATASMSLAQSDDATPVKTMAVTAGQGGTLWIPAFASTPQPYALTGQPARSDQAQWQKALGPRYRVGQADITLPASR